MGLVTTPHDKYFRDTMADVATVKYFLEEYISCEIIKGFNLDKMEDITDYYFNEQYKEYFTDLLFSAPPEDGSSGQLFFFFEHKSYLDYKAPLQVLGYMVEIWKERIEKKEKPTLIVPILFYHGKDDWNIGSSLGDLFDRLPDWILSYFPEFKYYLFDTKVFREDTEKLPQHPRFGAFIRLLIASSLHSIRSQLIGEGLRLADLVSDYFFERSSMYILSTYDISLNELLIISQHYVPERSGVIMTLANQLRREGEKEGLIKGEKKGEKKGAEKGMDITLKLLSKFGPDSIYLVHEVKMLVNDCSIKTVESAVDHAQSISQLQEMMVAIKKEKRKITEDNKKQ